MKSITKKISCVVLCAILIGILAAPCGYAAQQTIQTTCPVLTGNKINPDVYTDYKGKRVYFCCPPCKAEFEKNPQKYLSRLPQFASVVESGHNHEAHEHGEELMSLSGLIVPMGIITLLLVAAAVFSSAFRKINVRLMMKWHKRFGYAALISGAIHAFLVLSTH